MEWEEQKQLLEIVQPYIKEKKINNIRISTRPDAIDKKQLKLLKKYHVKTIELGVQSSNNYILAKCQRGHGFEEVKKASRLIRWNRFELGHQMMVGLPDSTEKDDLQTAKDLIKLKPKMVRIYPVLVIRGTKLAEEYYKDEFQPLNVIQAVERCKEIVTMFRKKNIQVIRVGLQNSDTIDEPIKKESDVLAGPYHPAFGQLVEDAIWYDRISEEIKKINAKVLQVEIESSIENRNYIIGHKQENLKRLKEIYAVEANFKENHQLKGDKFLIKIIKQA